MTLREIRFSMNPVGPNIPFQPSKPDIFDNLKNLRVSTVDNTRANRVDSTVSLGLFSLAGAGVILSE
jgi:hypothetical protein